MKICLIFIFLLSLASCKTAPKNTSSSKSPNRNQVNSAPVISNNLNNINVAFIKSQLTSLDSQIGSMDMALNSAKNRLEQYKYIDSTDGQSVEGMISLVEAEISNYQSQKEGLKAQKAGLENQLMLNQ